MSATLYVDYPNIDAICDKLAEPLPAGSLNESRGKSASDRWDLSLGYDGAYDAYTGGWAEGARRAEELAATLAPRPMGTRTALRRSVTGAFPNVGAHLAGAPNAMYQVSRKAAQGRPYVHLYLPVSYAARVDANTAFDKGCAMVALIDALETAGCRVAVTLTFASALATRVVERYQVKGYGDRLDIDQIIFTAAHPAFFRRIVFALIERSPHKVSRDSTRGGYGHVTPLREEDCPTDGNAVRVILPTLSVDDNGRTPESFLAEMVKGLPETIRTEIDGAA